MHLHWFKEQRETRDLRALVRFANEAIAQVGDVVRTPNAAFFDEEQLPADKEKMHWAFKIAITAERNAVRTNLLCVRWLRLADFQPGIGEGPIVYPAVGVRSTPEAKVASDRYAQMNARVTQERSQLRNEIRAFISAKLSGTNRSC